MEQKNKREDVLRAAYELFLEHGYDNTSMAKIAKRAKVAVSHAYYFFENKEEILDAAIRMAQDTYHTKMAAVLSECKGMDIETLAEHCFCGLDRVRNEAAFVMHSLLTPKLTERVKKAMVEHNSVTVQAMLAPVFAEIGGRDYSGAECEVITAILLGIINTYFMEGGREKFKRAVITVLKWLH